MENSSVLLKLSRQPLSLWSSSFVQESGSVSQVCCIRFSRTVGQKLSLYSMYEGGFDAKASFQDLYWYLGNVQKMTFFAKPPLLSITLPSTKVILYSLSSSWSTFQRRYHSLIYLFTSFPSLLFLSYTFPFCLPLTLFPRSFWFPDRRLRFPPARPKDS